MWQVVAQSPVLEKVKAHDETGLELRMPKTVGNDRADRLAGLAVTDATVQWQEQAPFADPLRLRNSEGAWVVAIQDEVVLRRWGKSGAEAGKYRPWLNLLYPPGRRIDWRRSKGIFRTAKVGAGDQFIHPVPQAAVKWVAQLRTGAVNTAARKFSHKMEGCVTNHCASCPLGDTEVDSFLALKEVTSLLWCGSNWLRVTRASRMRFTWSWAVSGLAPSTGKQICGCPGSRRRREVR